MVLGGHHGVGRSSWCHHGVGSSWCWTIIMVLDGHHGVLFDAVEKTWI